MCLSRSACRNSHRLVGGEVGKEAEGVGGKVDISGVHRHSQQEHCNDDYTHTHTHTHTHTCTHTQTHAHTHTRTQRGREGGKHQINHDHSYAEKEYMH